MKSWRMEFSAAGEVFLRKDLYGLWFGRNEDDRIDLEEDTHGNCVMPVIPVMKPGHSFTIRRVA